MTTQDFGSPLIAANMFSNTLHQSEFVSDSHNTLKDLLAQRAALDAQIAQTKEAELSGAIQQVRDLMARYDLTIADLSARAPRGSKIKEPSKVAAKYRDKETGASWSGRGLKPKWLKAKIEAGAKIDDFAV